MEDMTGKRYGNLIIEGIHETTAKGNKWLCSCGCGNKNKIAVYERELLSRNKLFCGECKNQSLLGRHFGKLTVIHQSINNNYICKCRCNNTILLPSWALVYGVMGSCGCESKVQMYKQNNLYKQINAKITLVYASNTGTEFLLDTDIYEEVKEKRWFETAGGNICTYESKKNINILKLIFGKIDEDKQIYFKDSNKLNLVKSNIYIDKRNKNAGLLRPDNTTGCRGVSRYGKNKYRAQIMINGKNNVLGVVSNVEDAISLRLKAEKDLL